MLTYTDSVDVGNGKILVQAVCLSTDTKPTTGIANGSTLIEINTSKTYMFDEESGEWDEVSQGGGGGGGSGSSDFSTAQMTIICEESADTNKNITDIVLIEDGALTTSVRLPYFDSISNNGTKVCTVVLYDGNAYGYLVTDDSVTVSGDATYDDGDIYITGDCTITIE